MNESKIPRPKCARRQLSDYLPANQEADGHGKNGQTGPCRTRDRPLASQYRHGLSLSLSLSPSCSCRCCRVGPRDQSPSRESGSDLTPSLSCCAKEATPGRSFGSRPIPVRRSRLRGDGGEPEKLGLYCISPVREGFLWKVRAKSLFRRARRGQPALRRALLLWRCLASSKLAYDENPSDLSLSEFPAQAEPTKTCTLTALEMPTPESLLPTSKVPALCGAWTDSWIRATMKSG